MLSTNRRRYILVKLAADPNKVALPPPTKGQAKAEKALKRVWSPSKDPAFVQTKPGTWTRKDSLKGLQLAKGKK